MIRRILMILSFIFIVHNPSYAKGDVQVVTSFYPMYIMTLNILDGVPGVKLSNLTKETTGCLHDYQLTPQDMVMLSKASLFVVNGGGMESFLAKVIKTRKNLKVIEASKGIKFIQDEDHGHHDKHGHEEESGNPHVWLSPTLAMAQVKNISEQLSLAIPEQKVLIEKNAAGYLEKIEKLKNEMKKELENLSTRNFVTFHEAFPYFAQEFNLVITDVIEREPGTEPSSKEFALIIKKLRTSKSKVIFAEPQYSAKSAQMMAKESGARVFHLDPLVTGTMDKEAYLLGMRKNLVVLKEALTLK